MDMVLRDLADVVAWCARREPIEPETPTNLLDVLARLETMRSTLVRQFADVCGYAIDDADALWADQVAYLNFLAAGELTPAATSKWTHSRRGHDRHGRTEAVPYESTVVSLPSNAPVPLTAIFAGCAGITGARVLFTAPRPVAAVVGEILGCFERFGEIAVAQERTSRVIRMLLNARVVDHVYFLGSSDAYQDLAGRCAGAGAALTFEGQGNSIAVVSATARPFIARVGEDILRAKQFCSGRMCTSPSIILADVDVFDDLCRVLAERAASHPLPRPLDEEVTNAEWRETVAGAREVVPDVHHPRASQDSPAFVVLRDASRLPQTESFSPVAAIHPVGDFGEALRLLRETPFRLQVSYYGSDRNEVAELRRIRFARYCVNIDPSDQDPLAPWGNFGASGDSRVVNFVEKFRTPVLIEEAVL